MRQRLGMNMLKPIRQRIMKADLAEKLRMFAPPGEPDACWEWTRAFASGGYGAMSIGDGKGRNAHVVAWELANNRPAPRGMMVRHTCDNPPCCNPSHLVLGTNADNVADKVARGRQPRGTQIPWSKLTEDSVREIRYLAASGIPMSHLAKRFDVSEAAISYAVKRKTWKHVD